MFQEVSLLRTWDNETKSIRINKDSTFLLYPSGSNKFFINGEEKIFYPEGIILKDRILVPTEFFISLGMVIEQEGTSISLICKNCK